MKLEIVGKGLSGQSFDVLEQERAWAKFAHGADRLWKHVTAIKMTTVLAA